jgi:HEAT repeat protein
VDWLEALSHDSPFERQAFAALGSQASLPLATSVQRLVPLLKNPDSRVRMRALTILEDIGGQAYAILPMLRAALKEAALKDADEAVRTRAVHAVLRVGPKPDSSGIPLIASLQDELDVVRFHAAATLGDLGRAAEFAIPALLHAALWDGDLAVRVEAAVALWKIDRKGPVVLPVLIEALNSDNELLCWIAADCLGGMGPAAREAIPALQQALGRPFKISLIQQGVALALERVTRQPSVPPDDDPAGPGSPR